MNIGILKLPEATAAKTGNLFIVEKPDVTEKISFENLQFGLDNVTFANTVSAHSSQIQYLTTTVYNLSTSLYSNFDFLTDYVNNLSEKEKKKYWEQSSKDGDFSYQNDRENNDRRSEHTS